MIWGASLWLIGLLPIGLLGSLLWLLYYEERRHRRAGQPTGRLRQTWPESDRRRDRRHHQRVEVRYTLRRDGKGANGLSLSRDLSGGGMCVVLDEKLPPHAAVNFELVCPDPATGTEHRVAGIGEVVWTREERRASAITTRSFVTGVRFVEFDEAHRHALLQFLDQAARTALTPSPESAAEDGQR